MKHLLLALALFGSAPAFAQETSTMDTSSDLTLKDWTIEAQLNTMSHSQTMTFGPSALYNFNEWEQGGFRFLAPLTYGSGTTSLMGVYRYAFSADATNLFAEATGGFNFYSADDGASRATAPSIGTNLGIIHHLNEGMSFGGLAGAEWTQTRLEKYQVSTASGIVLYGRLSIFGSLTF